MSVHLWSWRNWKICRGLYDTQRTSANAAEARLLHEAQRMEKYWDHYDNQPIVWIEDPGDFDTKFNVDDVNAFKMLISTGACLMEVKYGSVQFDSYLVIVTSNVAPWDLAHSAGPTSFQPVMDRVDGNHAARKFIYARNKEYVRGQMYKDIIAAIFSVCCAHNLLYFDPAQLLSLIHI